MEVQIQELIDKIKNEGVAEAEKSKADILQAAEDQAAALVNDAKKEAEKIVSEARREADKFHATGKQAVIQAGRDLILNLKAEITRLFNGILDREIARALDRDTLKTVLVNLLRTWGEKGGEDLEVLLSPGDKEALGDYLLAQLKDTFKKGVEIKATPDINAGFRISEKNGSAYYDLTDQGLGESLKPLLNTTLADCVQQALTQE